MLNAALSGSTALVGISAEQLGCSRILVFLFFFFVHCLKYKAEAV